MAVVDDVKNAINIIDLMSATGGAVLAEHGRKFVGWHTIHESTSKNSLHVDPQAGVYHCFNCGEGGDSITWMGHRLYNSRYSDRDRTMFFHALQEVAKFAGVAMPEADPAAASERRGIEQIYQIAVAYFHDQLPLEQREWLHTRYGLTDQTINDLRIGFAPADEKALFRYLNTEHKIPAVDLLASGLFTQHNDRISDLFQGRLVFPYWRAGRVVYSIARETEQSPQWERERRMKYKKLLVHSEKHPYVSPTVTNEFFYGEDTARGAEMLLVTEGITDCIIAHQHGFACVSPVTVQFRNDDVDKIATLAQSAKRVYIINDNEDNGAGDKGAMSTARLLWQRGVQAYMVTLPRPEGIEKVDLNDFLRTHDADALKTVMQQANTILDIAIAALTQAQGADQDDALQTCVDLLRSVHNKIVFNRYAGQICKGGGIGKRELLALVSDTNTASDSQDDDRYRVINGRICERTNVSKAANEPIYEYRALCNFIAHITADVLRDDGDEIERCVSLAGSLDSGEVLPAIVVRAAEFEAMGWPVGHWGGRVSIEPGRGVKDTLRHAIQWLSAATIETHHTYTHTGWRIINGQRVFLHAGGAIGLDGVTVDLPGNLKLYHLPTDQEIDPVAAMQESIKLLAVAPAHVAYPIWALVWLPILGEFITAAFVAWIEGQSGSLKSSLLAVALNHYGPEFHEYALPADWQGTVNSIEKLSYHAKDVLFVVDDFKPAMSQTENRRMQDAAARVMRSVGNRQGRSRLDSNAAFKRTYTPRGVVASTAERGAAGLSVKSRLLNIDIEPGDVSGERLASAQGQRHIYGYAMRGFIEWVASNWGDLAQSLPGRVADVRSMNSVEGQHKRLPNATATVYIAFDVAMTYATEIGAVDEVTANAHRDQCYEALQQIAKNTSEDVESQDPALMFVSTLVTLLAQKKAFIAPKGLDIALGSEMGERLGWWDGTRVYLLPSAYNAVYQFAQKQGETLALDPTTLAKELRRRGYLAETSSNRIQAGRRDESGAFKKVYVLAYKRIIEVAENLSLSETDIQIVDLNQ